MRHPLECLNPCLLGVYKNGSPIDYLYVQRSQNERYSTCGVVSPFNLDTDLDFYREFYLHIH